MFVTDLIKHKEYREFLDTSFASPLRVSIGAKKIYNQNPSLTGNAFEIFFLLVNSTANPKKLYKEEFERAERNILILKKGNYGIQDHRRGGSYIKLPAEDYKLKISVLERLFENKNYFKKGKLQSINHVKITNSIRGDIKSIIKAREETELFLWPQAATITIYDLNSYSLYYKSILDSFLEQAYNFQEHGKLTKAFLKVILQFTHLSHPFFSMSEPLKNIHFDNDYIKSVHRHFNQFSKTFHPLKGKIIKKPCLESFKILATPDFIINGRIIELKTSKKISKRDCRQALSYLLFAQFPENRKAYGKITSVIIYYSLLNQQVEIKLDNLKLTLAILNKVKVQIQSFYKHCMKRYEI